MLINQGYAPVNGINLYYEVHGTGKPLIMLHGGFGSFEMLSGLASVLEQKRQVIGVDLYGHGHTALNNRPIHVETLADDIASLIEYLHLEHVDVLGYSFGGLVALQTAIRHSARVSRLIVISTPFKWASWYPEVQASMDSIAPETFLETPVYYAYRHSAPRPEDFPRFIALMGKELSRHFDWTDELSALRAPTLIIAGDMDAFPLTHAVDFFYRVRGREDSSLLANGQPSSTQLAILPAATHQNIIYRVDLLQLVLVSFLRRDSVILAKNL